MSNRVFFPHVLVYQDVFEPPVVPAAPAAPDLSWQPSYPDMVPRAPALPVAILASFLFAPVEPPAAPPLDPGDGFPYPTYPDMVPDGVALHVSLQQTFAGPVIPEPDLSWLPEYPDFGAPPAAPRVVEFQSYAAPAEPPAIPPAPDLSWQPEYPDMARGAEPVNVGLQWWAGPIEPLAPPPVVPDLSWLPEYPDQVLPAPRVAVFDAFATSEIPVSQILPPPLSWAPSFPDIVPGAARPVDVGWLAQNVEPIIPPAPDLSWSPEYPDLVRAQPRATEFPSGVQNIEPIVPPFDPAALSWLPEYPDFGAPPTASRVVEFQSYAAPLLPPPVVPAPDLSWQPSYPDMVPGASRLVAFPFLARPVESVRGVGGVFLFRLPVRDTLDA